MAFGEESGLEGNGACSRPLFCLVAAADTAFCGDLLVLALDYKNCGKFHVTFLPFLML